MRKLRAFHFITLNGFSCGPNGEIDWHRHGPDENRYAVESMKQKSILAFGRKTYDLMASYWPTSFAKQNDPLVAEGMNRSEKIVFSNTITNPEWENTTVIGGDILSKMRELKNQPGNDITILGSGSIISLFAGQHLLDELQIMIDPVAISSGKTLFSSITSKLDFKLTAVDSFPSGVILASYIPLK